MTLSTEWSTIRDAAVTLISGISNIGNVYGYQRYTPDSGDFAALFNTTIAGVTSVRGWIVTVEDLDVDTATLEDWDVTVTLMVHGWLSLSDAAATEQAFIGLCEQVVMALANEHQFGSSAVIDYGRTRMKGPDLVVFPPGTNGTLCHHAAISKVLTLDQSVVWT